MQGSLPKYSKNGTSKVILIDVDTTIISDTDVMVLDKRINADILTKSTVPFNQVTYPGYPLALSKLVDIKETAKLADIATTYKYRLGSYIVYEATKSDRMNKIREKRSI
jgi:hypothetical protein